MKLKRSKFVDKTIIPNDDFRVLQKVLESAVNAFYDIRSEMADAGKITVQYLNIMEEMKKFNEKMREISIKDSTEEKIKVYDCGVKNTMKVLGMLLKQEDGRPSLIYNKTDAETSEIVRYTNLSTVIKELLGEKNTGGIGMDKQDERKLLNTLKSIDGTLKRIEQALGTKKERFVPEICDSKGNVRKCYGKPVANPEN